MSIKINPSYYNKLRAKLNCFVIAFTLAFLALVLGYWYLANKSKELSYKQAILSSQTAVTNKTIHESWQKLEKLKNTQNILFHTQYNKYYIFDIDYINKEIIDLASYYKIDSPIELFINHIKSITLQLNKKLYLDNYLLTLKFNHPNDESVLNFLITMLNNLNLLAEIQTIELKQDLKEGIGNTSLSNRSLTYLIQIKLQSLNTTPSPIINNYSTIINQTKSSKTFAEIEEIYNPHFWTGSLMQNN
jgi:hypothetical protein